jgi:hypothetical protein
MGAAWRTSGRAAGDAEAKRRGQAVGLGIVLVLAFLLAIGYLMAKSETGADDLRARETPGGVSQGLAAQDATGDVTLTQPKWTRTARLTSR